MSTTTSKIVLSEINSYASMADAIQHFDSSDEGTPIEKLILDKIAENLVLQNRFFCNVVLGHNQHENDRFEKGLRVGVIRHQNGTQDILEISIFRVKDPAYDGYSLSQSFLAGRETGALRSHFFVHLHEFYNAF